MRVAGGDEREIFAAGVGQPDKLVPVLAEIDGLGVVLAIGAIGTEDEVVQQARTEWIAKSDAEEVGGEVLPPTLGAYRRGQRCQVSREQIVLARIVRTPDLCLVAETVIEADAIGRVGDGRNRLLRVVVGHAIGGRLRIVGHQ